MPEETVSRSAGLVVRVARGGHMLRSLSWGFQLLTREMRDNGADPTPVNLIANLTSPMWEELVRDPRYRCVIPVTHFAEPAGYAGAKTRTWYSAGEEPIFARGGLRRKSPDWCPVFAGMTTASNDAVVDLDLRMPVLLYPHEYDRSLGGSIQDVIEFQLRRFPSDRLEFERTDDLWVRRDVVAPTRLALGI